MLFELLEDILILSESIVCEESLILNISLEVTIGLVQGDCSGVVWQLWWRGPWFMCTKPLRPTTGEPIVS